MVCCIRLNHHHAQGRACVIHTIISKSGDKIHCQPWVGQLRHPYDVAANIELIRSTKEEKCHEIASVRARQATSNRLALNVRPNSATPPAAMDQKKWILRRHVAVSSVRRLGV